MRCKTLADVLRDRGAEIRFICREHPGNLIQMLRSAGYTVAQLPAPANAHRAPAGRDDYAAWLGVEQAVDAAQTIEALADFEPDWLVVDHYGLDAVWERRLRSRAPRIFVVDDLANRPHDCDVLLDQNLRHGVKNCYAGLVPSQARLMLGPRFALLRPEFRNARESLRERDGTVRRIMVFFGGVDPTGETAKALDAIERLGRPDIAVDVVVGASNPQAETIVASRNKSPNVVFHNHVSNMAELMSRADLALGAGGGTSWERCCVGLPTLITSIAENQAATTEALASIGAAVSIGRAPVVGVADYVAGIGRLTTRQLSAMQVASLAIVDGRGTERVALSLCDEPMRLRRARSNDADKTWVWRNHEDTRRYFVDPSPVPLETHRLWWEKVLADNTRVLLLASRCGTDVGVLRYDLSGDVAVVSVYLDPELHGIGLGSVLLRAGEAWLNTHYPATQAMEAAVLAENGPSQRAFAAAGFQTDGSNTKWKKILAT